MEFHFKFRFKVSNFTLIKSNFFKKPRFQIDGVIDFNILRKEIVSGLQIAASLKNGVDLMQEVVKNANSKINKCGSMKELYNAVVNIYTSDTFIYRDLNSFMLDYEQEKSGDKKKFELQFKAFGPFAWCLDNALKLTPLSPDNIWSANEEIHSSKTDYFLFRSLYLNEDVISHYENLMKEKSIKAKICDLLGNSGFTDIIRTFSDQKDLLYWEGFSSTTLDKTYLFKREYEGDNVQFFIRPCAIKDEFAPIASLDRTNLKCIKNKSDFKEEEEVLLPPGISFKIDEIETKTNKYHKQLKITTIKITLNPECDFVTDPENPSLLTTKTKMFAMTQLFGEGNYSRSVAFVKENLENFGLTNKLFISVQRTKCLLFPGTDKSGMVFAEKILFKPETIPLQYEEKLKKFNENIQNYFESTPSFFKLVSGLQPLEKAPSFSVQNIFNSKKGKEVVKSDAKKTLILLFWSFKTETETHLIKKIYEDLQKNKKWVSPPDIQILFVNTEPFIQIKDNDSQLGLLIEHLLSLLELDFLKNPKAADIWKPIILYELIDLAVLKFYGSIEKPRIVIINENGTIHLNTWEENYNLRKKIFSGGKANFLECEVSTKPKISRKDFFYFKSILYHSNTEFHQAMEEFFNKLVYGSENRLWVKLKKEKPIGKINEKQVKTYNEPIAKFKCETEIRDVDLELLRKILSNYKIPFNQNKNLTVLETFFVEPGNKCRQCELKLGKGIPHYYCKACNVYYCKKCGDFCDPEKKGKGNNQYIDQHPLILINVESNAVIERFDVYKLGKNIIFGEETKNFNAICNGCQKEIIDIRWICLNCRPGGYQKGGYVDICNECMNILLDGDLAERKMSILKELEKEKHNHSSHLFLRVCFCKSYKEY